MGKKSGKKSGAKGGGGSGQAKGSPGGEGKAASPGDELPLGELSLSDKQTNGHGPHEPQKAWTDGLPLAPPGEEPVYVYSPAGQKITQYQLDNVGPVNTETTNVPEGDIPEVLCCPITQEVLRNPVVAADGVTYEKDAIVDWLKDNNTSPMTNAALADKRLIPNKLLRDVLELLYAPNNGQHEAA